MKQQSVYNKYPDLLKVDDDPELSQLVDALDKLCRQHQPPEDLVNLSIAQSLRAREAESYAVPLPKPQTLRHLNLARPARKPFRWLLRFVVVLLGLAIVIGGALVLFTKMSGGFPSSASPNANSVGGYSCTDNGVATPSPENARSIQVGCNTLYLPQVQADNDRITIVYILANSNSPLIEYTPFKMHLFDSQGHELKRLGGVPSGRINIQESNTAYSQINSPNVSYIFYGRTAGEEWFDASSLSGYSPGSAINLRLEIEAFSLQVNNRTPNQPNYETLAVIQGPFNFNLTTPYQNSALVSSLNLTDTVSGQAVTLEKVVRRPDYTRLYLRGINGSLDFDLNAAGLYVSISSDQTNYNNSQQVFTTQDGETIVQINNSLQDRKGDWRLTLHPELTSQKIYNSPNQSQNVVNGPWFFQFKLTG